MAKQANKTLIGGFVVGAVALIVAGVLVFGSGKFFQARNKYVLFFQGSLKGLNVGAPVLFQGVQVGSVIDITIEADAEKQTRRSDWLELTLSTQRFPRFPRPLKRSQRPFGNSTSRNLSSD
jgi:hypothetical protein